MELSQKICNNKELSGIFKNAIEAKKIEEEFRLYKELAEEQRASLIKDVEKYKKDSRDSRNSSISYKFKFDTLQEEISKKE